MFNIQSLKVNHNRDSSLSQHRIYLFLFLLSGIAGLIYEVLWVRQFAKIFGSSTYGVTIVLTSFMLGLSLGAWVIGKIADTLNENRLIRLYIILETAIGGYALLLPFILKWAETIYIGFYQIYHPGTLFFYGFKIMLAFLILVIPTSLLGATLPVMSRYIIREKKWISLNVSQLYAANTIGAIIGTIATGYMLIPNAGIRLTNFIAVGLNFTVAAVFRYVSRRSATSTSTWREKQTGTAGTQVSHPLGMVQKAVISAFLISGGAAMFYEVAWTRTLSMILGTTTYAFTTMLAAFLTGIGFGSILYRWIPSSISKIRLFSILQGIIGLTVLMTIPAFEKLPFLFLTFNMHWGDTWLNLQFIRFILAFLIMIVPTLAMGILFPVVSSLFIDWTSHVGSRLGKAYAWNTTGAAAGAALAGLVLIPGIGMQKTIIFGAVLNIVAGLGVYMVRIEISLFRRGLVSAAIVLTGLLLVLNIAPWAPKIMSSGPYIYSSQYEKVLDRYRKATREDKTIPQISEWKIWEMVMKQYRLLYYKPGITSTVAVMERDDGVRFLTIDGKTDASTGMKSDMRTQTIIGQLPLLFHNNPEEVLIVGLGSGITAGSVLTHNVKIVDCAEISPAVIEAATFFANANHNALKDKRLRIIPQDARNMLLTSKKEYDVIISQPSNPWIRGESSLFSMEWYSLVNKHMNKGGLFLQWVPSYLMDETDLKIIFHTVRSVFPNLTLWSSGSAGDLILVARKGLPLRLDYNLISQKIKHEKIRQDIIRTGLNPMLLPFRLFVMNEKKLSIYLYGSLKQPLSKNTDDRLITEFSAPKWIAINHNVDRFLDPELIHGKVRDVMAIMDNIKEEDFLHILDRKARDKEGVIKQEG